jgi:hypothetical protein
MLLVVSSCQELSGDPQNAVIAPVCITVRTSMHFVHMEQKITSTTQTQPRTMFDANICSNNKYGGFRAATANLLHHPDHATPARAVAAESATPTRALAAARAPRHCC